VLSAPRHAAVAQQADPMEVSTTMKLNAPDLRRPAGVIALLVVITTGLALAGCGSSGGKGAGSAGPGSGSAAAAAKTGSSARGGSGSGTTSAVSAASVPFPAGVGDTWTYKDVVALGADGRSVNKIVSVRPVAAGQQVKMTTAITTDGTTRRNDAYYVLQPDGAISLPFSQFSSADSGADVRLISGSAFWPPAAQLASGHKSRSTLKIEYTIGGKAQKIAAHITVKGAGTQTVTVPAGTYANATVVEMTMSEKIDGYNVSIEVRTWLASGVGPVKSEAILHGIGSAGNDLASENELVSFTRG
jgi:hypothetical protein